jgi:hypothetical protein
MPSSCLGYSCLVPPTVGGGGCDSNVSNMCDGHKFTSQLVVAQWVDAVNIQPQT